MLFAGNVIRNEHIACYNIHGLFSMNAHQHESIEMNFVGQGRAVYIIDDVPVRMKKGEMMVLDSTVRHKLIVSDPEARITSIHIDIHENDHDLSGRILDKNDTYYVITASKLIHMVFTDVVNTLYDNNSPDIAGYGIYYLFDLFCRNAHSSLTQKIKDYIIDHYPQIHSIEEVAAKFHFSKSHLQSIFKHETGRPIGSYINDVKMNNACYLLRNTDIPVGEIDKLVGFRSYQAFYGLFKTTYGISPKAYRNHKSILE